MLKIWPYEANNTLDRTALISIILSGTVIFTTIHAQDFADCEGDKQSGRLTLPIVAPNGSRIYILVALVLWSIGLARIWSLGPLSSAAIASAGALIGQRYYKLREVTEDEKSYVLYNVSLSPD